jgi:hypothetical protein
MLRTINVRPEKHDRVLTVATLRLLGVVNTLYDLQLTILSVERSDAG